MRIQVRNNKGELDEQTGTAKKREVNEEISTANIKEELNEEIGTADTKGELDEEISTENFKEKLDEGINTATIKMEHYEETSISNKAGQLYGAIHNF